MKTTLYLESPGFALRKSQEVFKVLKDGRQVRELPASQIDSVIVSCEGFSISGGAMDLCISHDIPGFYFQRNTWKMAMFSTLQSQWPERQAAQIRAVDNGERVFSLSRGFLTGKITNQLNLMKYMAKSRRLSGFEFKEQISLLAKTVRNSLSSLGNCSSLDIRSMRDHFFGIEGNTAAHYWKVFKMFLPQTMNFPGRMGRGALDPVNCLLNYGYAILARKVQYEVMNGGLLIHFGFLHTPQAGKATLVYDIMEEFRAWAVDKLVLSMVAKNPGITLDKAGRLAPKDRQRFVVQAEEKWHRIGLSELIKGQVASLISVIEQGHEYRSFIWGYSRGRRTKKQLDKRGETM